MTLMESWSGQCVAFGTLCSKLYEGLHTQQKHAYAYLKHHLCQSCAIRIRCTFTSIKHIRVHFRGHAAPFSH